MIHKTEGFYSPKTYQEAFGHLKRHSKKAAFLNGGVSINWNGNQSPFLISLDRVISKSICNDKESVQIGAGVTLSDIERSEKIEDPVLLSLKTACGKVASPQIRNMATIGGNLISHFDFSDTLGSLYVLKPQLEVMSDTGVNKYEFEHFISDKTLKFSFPKDLILNKLIFAKDKLKGYERSFFHKESRLKRDIATLNISFFKHIQKDLFDIAVGACWNHIQIFKNMGTLKEIGNAVSNLPAPKSDIRASSKYRSEILIPLIESGMKQCR